MLTNSNPRWWNWPPDWSFLFASLSRYAWRLGSVLFICVRDRIWCSMFGGRYITCGLDQDPELLCRHLLLFPYVFVVGNVQLPAGAL